MMSTFGITPHHLADVLLYLPFLAGQLVYIMKRAGFSMRAGRAATRMEYIHRNWDILGFRSVLEFILIYMPARHLAPAQILSLVHINADSFTSLPFLSSPMSGPVSLLALGIAADGLFDWLVDWASRSPKVPAPIKAWLSENVPPPPLVQQP
jgi:hypothetical protein